MPITPGTNSYATETELTDYAAERGITLTAAPAVLLIKSMDYIEVQLYQGEKTSSTQALQWPRTGVYIGRVLVDSSAVPADIKKAQLELSVRIDQGNDPSAPIERAVKREKVDVLETEYMDNASTVVQIVSVNRLLRPYLANPGYWAVRV